jgi:hypothetical protein
MVPKTDPTERNLERIRDTTLRLLDLETERLQERVSTTTRNAGQRLIAAVLGTAFLLLGVQAAVLALLFLLHERATQFIVRPGVAWPMAGLATALVVLGVAGLVWALGRKKRSTSH